ncbi:GntR family transcriptional regulator [Variovorax sp.]|uniref:GntR family transcriptional regulator n=1 Tax=Variovorax sp. TaxID=1871043 RepID=UPI002D752D13|nr:GntR family transcriptional regulator [Variovorax sp.]HYP85524.1 GntR family transcriptional regulator [Variovorax sp.]
MQPAESSPDPLSHLAPITRTSVNESVYQALRNKLMHGEYRAGQTLGIQYLADALGTSTMPVREALRRLVAQQGLEPLPNGTTRVPLITRERLADIRRNRVLVEGTALEWAAPHLGRAQLDELEKLANEITLARRTREGVATSLEKNLVFHFTLYQAAQSPVLLALIESLWLQSGAYLRATREFLHTAEQPADHLHEQTVAALRAGNPAKARQRIEADISWIFDRLDIDLK